MLFRTLPFTNPKITELTESNKELRALIVEAKDQLTKLNLENAKLVYQNKALNSASLNERQKNTSCRGCSICQFC